MGDQRPDELLRDGWPLPHQLPHGRTVQHQSLAGLQCLDAGRPRTSLDDVELTEGLTWARDVENVVPAVVGRREHLQPPSGHYQQRVRWITFSKDNLATAIPAHDRTCGQPRQRRLVQFLQQRGRLEQRDRFFLLHTVTVAPMSGIVCVQRPTWAVISTGGAKKPAEAGSRSNNRRPPVRQRNAGRSRNAQHPAWTAPRPPRHARKRSNAGTRHEALPRRLHPGTTLDQRTRHHG